jgi:hypothetical protein
VHRKQRHKDSAQFDDKGTLAETELEQTAFLARLHSIGAPAVSLADHPAVGP